MLYGCAGGFSTIPPVGETDVPAADDVQLIHPKRRRSEQNCVIDDNTVPNTLIAMLPHVISRGLIGGPAVHLVLFDNMRQQWGTQTAPIRFPLKTGKSGFRASLSVSELATLASTFHDGYLLQLSVA